MVHFSFGDFDLEPIGVRASHVQNPLDKLDRTVLQVIAGQVDRQLQIVTCISPSFELRASHLHDPLVQFSDISGCFGHLNEVSGWDHAPVRMLPAQQGLNRCDLAVRERNDGLVIHLEFASIQAMFEIGVEVF